MCIVPLSGEICYLKAGQRLEIHVIFFSAIKFFSFLSNININHYFRHRDNNTNNSVYPGNRETHSGRSKIGKEHFDYNFISLKICLKKIYDNTCKNMLLD